MRFLNTIQKREAEKSEKNGDHGLANDAQHVLRAKNVPALPFVRPDLKIGAPKSSPGEDARGEVLNIKRIETNGERAAANGRNLKPSTSAVRYSELTINAAETHTGIATGFHCAAAGRAACCGCRVGKKRRKLCR